MRPLLINIILLFNLNLFGQLKLPEQILRFKKTDYPSSKFQIKSDTSYLGQVEIIITMTSPKINNSIHKFYCRSWLTIKKNGKLLNQKYYEIEPVGGCSGLYTPTKQPCEDHFIISKFGDYGGQTLIVDTSGSLKVLIGGAFSLSKDNRYLFALYDSDISGITVFDLKNKKMILSEERNDDKEYDEFYYQDGKYFVSFFTDDKQSKEHLVGTIDIVNKKVTEVKNSKYFLKKSNILKPYNEVKSLTRCNCGK